MKRIMIFILAAVTSAVIVITLFLAYRFFPQDTVVFDNKEYSIINDFDIRINGTEKVEYNELPHNLHLNYKDTVSMSTVLEEPLVAGAVLFFRTMETSVTVSINGQQVYEYGNGSRIFGRAPFRVWHFVELPDDYLGKEVVITLQPLLHPSSIPTTICPVGLSTKATALWDYFYPAFGFLLFLAVNMALISVGFLIFSLVLMQHDKNALRIFYFFLIFLHISLWGICNNSMITLFIGNAYFIYCLHYILHASLIIPISLYFGESYQKRYKKLAHGIVMFDTVKLLLLVLSEVFTINTLAENIFIINATLFAELSILVAIAIKESEQNRCAVA